MKTDNKSTNPYISQFLDWFVIERGRSKDSAKAYHRELALFFSHLKTNSKKISIEEISKTHIRSFLAELGDISPSTRERTVSCIKSFFKFLINEGYISFNPAETISTPVVRKKVPNFFTKIQYQKLLKNLSGEIENLEHYRNNTIKRLEYHKKKKLTDSRDIILLLIMHGLNKTQIIKLTRDDYDKKSGRLSIKDNNHITLKGKTRSIMNYYLNNRNNSSPSIILDNQRKPYRFTTAILSRNDLLRELGFSNDDPNWKDIVNSLDQSKITSAYRNLAIIALFLSTGIRRAELVKLKKKDLNKSNSTIKVTRKGGDQQIIELNEGALDTIINYLNRRTDKHESFFLTSNNKPMTSENLHYIVKEILKQNNLKGSAHTLRHTFVTELVRSGVPLPVIQSLVGHKNANTTIRYTHIVSKDRRTAVSKISLGLK